MEIKNHFVSEAVGYRKFYRLPEPKLRYSARQFGNNACATMPGPSPSCDYASIATAAIDDFDGNDKLGDCFVALMAKFLGVVTANSLGSAVRPTLATVIADYSAISGYNGTEATDLGCDPEAGFTYWEQHGCFGQGGSPLPFAGRGLVDGSNQSLIRQVINQFMGVGICMGLPDAWIDPARQGPKANDFTWTIDGPPNPSNGHAFLGLGYDSPRFSWKGVHVNAWNLQGTIPWDAAAYYLVPAAQTQLYAMTTPLAINPHTGLTPTANQTWATLAGFANTLGASIAVPGPSPSPSPTPSPSASYVTYDNAAKTVIYTPDWKPMRATSVQGIIGTVAHQFQPPKGWSIKLAN